MNRNRRRVATVVGVIATVPLLAGCWQGFNAQENVAPPSGDGADASVGPLNILGAVWVRSETDPTTLTLVANFANGSSTPDALVGVKTDPVAGSISITGSKLDLPALSGARTGFNSSNYINAYAVKTPDSAFVPTTFAFANAGTVTIQVLTVPPTEIYAGITPGPSPSGTPAPPQPSPTTP